MAKMTPIVSVVGTSDAGKTTLLERLVGELKSRGYRVAVVKHDVHGFDIDHEGKDSWRLKRAGSDAVIISSPKRIAVIEDVAHDHSLSELRARLNLNVDLILSEGYKRENHPKIEVFRKHHRDDLLCTSEDNLLAVATDTPLDVGVPNLPLDDTAALADFIEDRFLRTSVG